MSERSHYIDSILTRKDAIEALEILRLRTSEAKLVDKEFCNVFSEYQKIRETYNSSLHSLIKKYDDKRDLKSRINENLVHENILSSSELVDYESFSNIDDDLSKVWRVFLNELQNEYSTSKTLNNLIKNDSLKPLQEFSERDPDWNKTRRLYSNLSSSTDSNDFSNEWSSKGPYLYELFENIDLAHLTNIKSSLLNYQTNYSEYLQNSTSRSEKPLNTYSEFDPLKEIVRFSNEASKFDFSFISNNPKQSQPLKKRSTFSNISSRLHSSSNLNSNDLMNDEFSDSTNNSSLKKNTNRLKSTMGTIFGRNKNKTNNSFGGHSTTTEKDINIDTVEEDLDIDQKRRSASRRATTNSIRPEFFKRDSFSNENFNESLNQEIEASPRLTKRMNSSTNDLENRNITRNVFQNNVQEATTNKSPFFDVSPSKGEIDQQIQSSTSPNGSAFSRLSIAQAPLKPALRSSQTDPVLPAASHPFNYSSTVSPSKRTSGQTLFTNVPNFNSPTQQQQYLSQQLQQNVMPFQRPPQTQSVPGEQQPPSNLFSQVTGDLQFLDPQSTGPVLSNQQGLSAFQHSESDNSIYGLNASIAEVINATFREGFLVESEIIGEIAFNYTHNPTSINMPSNIDVKIKNSSKFDKTILNQGYIEKVSNEYYKINPQFIDSKTLGGLKYLIKPAEAPIIILPVWNFELHQASVVLTLKLSPTLSPSVQKLVLEDLTIYVSVDGAETTSALSKPQGTFNKEKKRITWRFTEPLVLQRNSEERLIARFMTNNLATESNKGISAKFTIRENAHQNIAVGSALSIDAKEQDEKNPFGGPWKSINTTRTLSAGNYIGLSI